ncbi:uncharacterized protein LOC115232261 [Octopus sinensis]|uniref:Uncharacterized protein LOC115232261 n=1 Tax=Octopus sinensis TaxID=2607531 RepID=A0A6P7TZS0_9MOLL|nr:uncharacterized protein LOC115232261 [Octopus sinensis]
MEKCSTVIMSGDKKCCNTRRFFNNYRHENSHIFVHDKMKNEITLIKVGITSQDRLKQGEVEKCHKLLSGELSSLYPKVKILSLVLIWDGVVSKFFKKYIKKLAIEDGTRTYIQSVVLEKTLDSVVVEHRHGIN